MSEQAFLTHLQDHFHQICDRDGFKIFRKKSWDKLLVMGLPTKAQEAFRYIPLKDLYAASLALPKPSKLDQSSFAEAILPECAHSHLIFIDGQFSAELSDLSTLPPQMIVLPLDEALLTHGNFLQNHLARSIKEEKDPFAFLNLAMHSCGAFIYLPPKVEVVPPIQCLHIVTGKEPQILLPRVQLVLGAQSRMRWIATTYHLEKIAKHFIVPAMEISLEEGADLDVLTMGDAPFGWQMESMRAILKRNARFHALSITSGGKAVRQSYVVQLRGENSETHLSGLWMLSKNHTSHVHAILDHEAPHTRSMQRFKGVLGDVSQSSFEGKILVRPEAQKTEAYQLNNNLILSQGAVANSKPNLEVFADDVKASHGATFSQLDQEQLFYLSTRGIKIPEARRLLIGGFCREMIEQIPYDSLRMKVLTQIERYLDRGES